MVASATTWNTTSRNVRLHDIRTRYPDWFADLRSFARRSRWIPAGVSLRRDRTNRPPKSARLHRCSSAVKREWL